MRNWLSGGSERRVKSDGGAEGDRDEQEGRSAESGEKTWLFTAKAFVLKNNNNNKKKTKRKRKTKQTTQQQKPVMGI